MVMWAPCTPDGRRNKHTNDKREDGESFDDIDHSGDPPLRLRFLSGRPLKLTHNVMYTFKVCLI
ncbi:MAG: hypothetical protein WCE32_23155, partial [Pseudolabrys sp.]